ncbi:MAG TPA: cytochrome c oxidase assembly protein [Euzebyales bacterium]
MMMAVLAHGGELTGRHDVLSTWAWDPLVLAAVIVSCWSYAVGARALWRSAGRGEVVSRSQVAAYVLAMTAVFIALVSPLDPAAEALFSAHMTQHVLVTLVAAPLFVIAAPLQVLAWGLPPRLRRTTARWHGRVRRLLRHPALPAVGLTLFLGVFVAWHVPALYDAALASDVLHGVEHATMLAAALALWAPVVHPRRTAPGVGVLLLFISMIATGILSALLVFSPVPWYAHDPAAGWGVTALTDQQAAGAIMWVLGGGIHIAAGAAAVLRWLSADEQSAHRLERHGRVPGAAAG